MSRKQAKDAVFEQFARIGKAQGERSVEALARTANLNVTTTSAHLQALKQARADFLGPDDTQEVGREEVRRCVRAGDVVVIDVRPVEEFAGGHIPGARSFPLDQLAARLAELPTGVDVVAYCRGPYCVLSSDAVRVLHAHGRTVHRLTDGLLEWEAADLPVESADVA